MSYPDQSATATEQRSQRADKNRFAWLADRSLAASLSKFRHPERVATTGRPQSRID